MHDIELSRVLVLGVLNLGLVAEELLVLLDLLPKHIHAADLESHAHDTEREDQCLLEVLRPLVHGVVRLDELLVGRSGVREGASRQLCHDPRDFDGRLGILEEDAVHHSEADDPDDNREYHHDDDGALEAGPRAAAVSLAPLEELEGCKDEADVHASEQERLRVVHRCDEDAIDDQEQGSDNIEHVSELTEEFADMLLLDLGLDALLLGDELV